MTESDRSQNLKNHPLAVEFCKENEELHILIICIHLQHFIIEYQTVAAPLLIDIDVEDNPLENI
jgi:hypothetical protein